MESLSGALTQLKLNPKAESFVPAPLALAPARGESPSRTVLVASVDPAMRIEDLREMLEQFGALRALHVEQLAGSGVAQATFYDERDARGAVAALGPEPPLSAHYTLPPPGGPDSLNQGTLTVHNVGPETTEQELRALFEEHGGPVKNVREAGSGRTHTLVELWDTRDAEAAVAAFRKDPEEDRAPPLVHGRRLNVEFSHLAGAGGKTAEQPSNDLTNVPSPSATLPPHKPHHHQHQHQHHQQQHQQQSAYAVSYPMLWAAAAAHHNQLYAASHQQALHQHMQSSWHPHAHAVAPHHPHHHHHPHAMHYGAAPGTLSPTSPLSPYNSPPGLHPAMLPPGAMLPQGMPPLTLAPEAADEHAQHQLPPAMAMGGAGVGGGKGRRSGGGGSDEATPRAGGGGGGSRVARVSDEGEGVPAQFAFNLVEANAPDARGRTTLMIRNIPNKYSQRMLLSLLDKSYQGSYDFFYLPIDFKNRCNLGYAFVNFVAPSTTGKFFVEFNGKRWEEFNSKKVCEITYARVQGRQALVEHFRNSRFPCESGEYLPLVFEHAATAATVVASRGIPLGCLTATVGAGPSTQKQDAPAGAAAAASLSPSATPA